MTVGLCMSEGTADMTVQICLRAPDDVQCPVTRLPMQLSWPLLTLMSVATATFMSMSERPLR